MPSVNPTPEQLQRFLELEAPDGPVVMLNLLRFRERAEYPPGFEAEPASGREAYGRYAARAIEHVTRVGGRVVWAGQALACLIAPPDEHWDEMFLVHYPTRAALIGMVSDPDYQQVAVHRTAALADSRLIALRPETA